MSSKRHLRRRQCESKQRHATQAAAAAHAYHLRRKNGNDAYEAYRCDWGHWHAGRPAKQAITVRRERLA